jgi:hypothetical protein
VLQLPVLLKAFEVEYEKKQKWFFFYSWELYIRHLMRNCGLHFFIIFFFVNIQGFGVAILYLWRDLYTNFLLKTNWYDKVPAIFQLLSDMKEHRPFYILFNVYNFLAKGRKKYYIFTIFFFHQFSTLSKFKGKKVNGICTVL